MNEGDNDLSMICALVINGTLERDVMVVLEAMNGTASRTSKFCFTCSSLVMIAINALFTPWQVPQTLWSSMT